MILKIFLFLLLILSLVIIIKIILIKRNGVSVLERSGLIRILFVSSRSKYFMRPSQRHTDAQHQDSEIVTSEHILFVCRSHTDA